MGTLLPNYGNVMFTGAGQLNPLCKDWNYETIGIGTRIFLGGGVGYVIGEGTQHDPQSGFGTLMIRGDLKRMNSRYLRGASFYKYGVTLYVGIGIPIPIINERVAKTATLRDDEITVEIRDYGVPSRPDRRPVVKRVTYADLRSGKVYINGRKIPSSSLSSYKMAKEISEVLKKWILEGLFLLTEPVESLPRKGSLKPLRVRRREPIVRDLMRREVITAKPNEGVEEAARKLIVKEIDHLPVTTEDGRLVGIVTSWDLARAIAERRQVLSEIMTRRVITAQEDETIDAVAWRMAQHNISGMPVVDEERKVVGIITTDDVSKRLVEGISRR